MTENPVLGEHNDLNSNSKTYSSEVIIIYSCLDPMHVASYTLQSQQTADGTTIENVACCVL